MALPLSQVSRYIKTPLVSFDGKETYTKWAEQGVFITRPPENKITKYQVPQAEAGRPDLVALSVYSDSKFDWVIIAFNNPKSIFTEVGADLVEITLMDELFNGVNWVSP